MVTRPWVLGNKVLGSLSLLYCGFDIINEKTLSAEDDVNIADAAMLLWKYISVSLEVSSWSGMSVTWQSLHAIWQMGRQDLCSVNLSEDSASSWVEDRSIVTVSIHKSVWVFGDNFEHSESLVSWDEDRGWLVRTMLLALSASSWTSWWLPE